MVYLALDSTAAREAIAFARKTECSVWVGSDALDLYEFQSLIAQGVKVTRFSLPLLAASSELVESVASVVKQHHPNEIVWVQHVARL